MPYGNGTGPQGLGPMTGRAAGFCVESEAPGYVAPGFGRGSGGGRNRRRNLGRGQGGRGGFAATGLPGQMRWSGSGAPAATQGGPQAEQEALARRADVLQAQLDGIRRQLQEMNSAAETESE